MIDLALILACAPNVHPTTIKAIIKVESNGNPLAVNVNKKRGIGYHMPKEIKSIRQAVTVAKSAISAGHTVDMGYMQINSANLQGLGYTVEDMFNPCKNLAAGAKILTRGYAAEFAKHNGNEQAALRAALSIYNTGNSSGGFRNGYVQRYVPVVRVSSSQDPHKAGTAVSTWR